MEKSSTTKYTAGGFKYNGGGAMNGAPMSEVFIVELNCWCLFSWVTGAILVGDKWILDWENFKEES